MNSGIYPRSLLNGTLFTSAVLLLGACATGPEQDAPMYQTMPEIDAALSQDSRASPKNANPYGDVNAALMPPLQLNLPGSSGIDIESRFDIKVNRASARQFFMGLVQDTPYNMVVDPKVRGRVTLDLKNVTVAQVMDTVRDVYGYDYEYKGSMYTAYPNSMATRIFSVNYLDIQRSGSSQVRVNSGQLSDVQGGSSSSSNGQTNLGGSGPRAVQASSQIDTTTESSFWKDLDRSLQAIVGNKEGRSVVVSSQSGIVVVRAMPHELRTVQRFLDTTEDVVQRQVVLEAKIIEVQLADKFQAGINWSALASSRTGSNNALISHIGGGSVFDSSVGGLGTTSISGNSGDLNPASLVPVNGSSTSAFGGVFTLALSVGTDFTAFVELLKGQGNVQVLSSPKISTLNNTKAVIKVGEEEFFVTNVNSNTAVTTGTSNTSNNVELTPFFSGVVLDVVPQISEQGRVTLFIHPTVSKVEEQNKNVATSASDTLLLPLAFSTVRESDTIISAASGQIVVIGGLMQDKVTEVETSVPFFGDIPLLGQLFRHTEKTVSKTELVILLKPTVVDADGRVWRESMKRVHQRINALNSSGANPPGGK